MTYKYLLCANDYVIVKTCKHVGGLREKFEVNAAYGMAVLINAEQKLSQVEEILLHCQLLKEDLLALDA